MTKLSERPEYWWCRHCELFISDTDATPRNGKAYCPECCNEVFASCVIPAPVAEAYDAVAKAARTFIMDESVEFCDGLQGIEDSIKALDALPQEATDD